MSRNIKVFQKFLIKNINFKSIFFIIYISELIEFLILWLPMFAMSQNKLISFEYGDF